MNPVDTHTRHCDSCTKQVVDFSWMTDREIHRFAATHNGRLCGRFRRDQLHRPIRAVVPPATGWRTAAAATAMLLSVGVAGQSATPPLPPPSGDSIPEVTILGEMVSLEKRLPFTGRVLDQDGEPLVGATVLLSGTRSGTVTDLDGTFSLTIPTDGTLRIGYVGFEDFFLTLSQQHLGFTSKSGTDIHLFPGEETLPEVVVTGYQRLMGKVVMGGIMTVTTDELAPAPAPETVPASETTVYPNPFTDHLRIRLPEEHGDVNEVTLLDIQGRVVHRWPDQAGREASREMRFPIQRTDLLMGTYVLRWKNRAGMVRSKLVVKSSDKK
jgi:hypothetical protein